MARRRRDFVGRRLASGDRVGVEEGGFVTQTGKSCPAATAPRLGKRWQRRAGYSHRWVGQSISIFGSPCAWLCPPNELAGCRRCAILTSPRSANDPAPFRQESGSPNPEPRPNPS